MGAKDGRRVGAWRQKRRLEKQLWGPGRPRWRTKGTARPKEGRGVLEYTDTDVKLDVI